MTSQDKAYRLTFTEYAQYLFADLKGETISAEIIRDYIGEIVAKCAETGKNRILLYRDIPAVLSGGETFFTVSESLDALAGKKLAIVNPHSSVDSVVDFGVTVGQNRGGNYRSFDNVAAAEEWLVGSDGG